MTANGTGPQVDARQLAALRKRRLAEAGKALQALLDAVNGHRGELDAGYVPPAAGLRKLADKYLGLLDTLAIIDSILTPEALEAMTYEDDAGTVAVRRDDLALLTDVLRDARLTPTAVTEDTPLGGLTAAAYPGGLGPAEMAFLSVVPDEPGHGYWEAGDYEGDVPV